MTKKISDQELYERTVSLATKKKITREQIMNGSHLPFQLLYVEMAKRKEIPAMIELPEETKLKYWTEAKRAQPKAARAKQIWIAQSLYVFDLITQ